MEQYSPGADPGFPRGGANSKGSANLLFGKFSQKFMKMKKIGKLGGHSNFYFVDPPLQPIP